MHLNDFIAPCTQYHEGLCSLQMFLSGIFDFLQINWSDLKLRFVLSLTTSANNSAANKEETSRQTDHSRFLNTSVLTSSL